jgi:hypothetical protein
VVSRKHARGVTCVGLRSVRSQHRVSLAGARGETPNPPPQPPSEASARGHNEHPRVNLCQRGFDVAPPNRACTVCAAAAAAAPSGPSVAELSAMRARQWHARKSTVAADSGH